MLPIRLELRNFLAYRAPEPIAFDGISLACLTGQNGVGKSSILDAMTWALWGKARAKRDDDLIHLGQREAQVSLDFVQEGIRYRIVRRRALASRGSRGTLDLLVWSEDGAPRMINEAGLRRTQEKINEILRLDYETFVHSAFLQQGRADAFTTKTAAERKRILADLLGLDRWAAYDARARDQLNDLSRQIDILAHDIGRIELEIAGEPQLQQQMDAVALEHADAQSELDRITSQHQAVVNAAALLGRERENLSAMTRRIRACQDDIAAAEAEIERQTGKIVEYESIIAGADDTEAGYLQLLQAREDQSAIAEQLAQKNELDAQAHKLEKALNAQRTALQRERDVRRERIKNLEEQLATAAEADLEGVRSEVAALLTLDTRRNDVANSLQKLKERRSGLSERLQILKQEGRALNERMARLEAADGAICPLCGQDLTASHRDQMLAALIEERDGKRDEYRLCSQDTRQLDEESRAGQTQLDDWALQLKDLPALQQRMGALESQHLKAQEAGATLESAQSELRHIEEQLQSENYGGELRRQLAELDEARSRIGYDADSHADVRAQLENLSAFERQQKLLEFARLNLPEAQNQRQTAISRLESLGETLASDQGQLAEIESTIQALDAQVAQERDLRIKFDAKRAEVSALQERRTILRQELNAIASGRVNKRRLEERLDAGQEQRSMLGELRAAFGKNGVPAMIIEAAIPELEAEANDLLARMTDGRMTIALHTQRERSSGELAETLDIEISDELGARDYELFSGGEAFRINFALRIALSKLLARRAGAHLRTLFIDEGFGSQDVDGRDKLVDAISRIQSDFDLILVITHFEELRESFPVQMVVEKTANGSTITLR